MKQVSVPVTRGMIDDLLHGQVVGWDVDNLKIRLTPTFNPEEEAIDEEIDADNPTETLEVVTGTEEPADLFPDDDDDDGADIDINGDDD